MKEREDHIEIEFKIEPPTTDELLRAIAMSLGSNYNLIKASPRVIVDIYLDSENRSFHRHGASFRMRRWGSPYTNSKRYSINFKPPHDPEAPYFSRREIKTDVDQEEGLSGLMNDDIPGLAAHKAYEYLMQVEPSITRPAIVPVVEITTYREVFSISPPLPGYMYPIRKLPLPAFAALVVDNFTAFDTSNLPYAPWASVSVQYKDSARVTQGRIAEVEQICLEVDRWGHGKRIMGLISNLATKEAWAMPKVSKYSWCMNELGYAQ